MNPCIPDWNLEAELPMPSQKKPFRLDDGLVELLWQNGQVVLHSQNHRKPGYDPNENRQVSKHDQSSIRASCSCENPSNLIQENDAVSWLHTPVDDPFEKEFCSNFLSDIPGASLIQTDKPIQQFENNKTFKFDASNVNYVIPSSQNCGFNPNPLPPLKFRTSDPSHHATLQDIAKSLNFQSPDKNDLRYSNGQYGDQGHYNMMQGEIKECSVMTVGSSHSGSNQVAMDADTSRVSTSGIGNGGFSASVVKNYVERISPHNEKSERETLETAITSSSGGSGSSFGKTCNLSPSTNSHKRKTRDAEESECQSEAAALDSAGGDKPTQKSGTSRRSRAAEVHNLSERRRRDRINEKMKALQELIPHSNKSDKASMLDEAIEYMKSLQLQLQMLWMGSGMAPMMFPGVQHYMSRMGIGMAPPTLPPIHGAMHLPRLPLVDQAINIAPTPNQAALCQTSVLNAVNLQNQLRNPNFSDQYGSYLGFHPLQSASQPINMFSFGPNAAQQNSMLGQPRHSTGPSTR